jgi:hypothetical protein
VDISRLERLKIEILNDESYTEDQKNFGVSTVNLFLRGHELNSREEEYYQNGYYFGYLLIASQRIENSLKVLIKCVYQKFGTDYLDEDLNKPLGVLIRVLFEKIECNDLEKELVKFKEIRDKVVHRLYQDLEQSLASIEADIKSSAPLSKITNLQGILIILSAELNPQQPFGQVIKSNMKNSFGSFVLSYKLKD